MELESNSSQIPCLVSFKDENWNLNLGIKSIKRWNLKSIRKRWDFKILGGGNVFFYIFTPDTYITLAKHQTPFLLKHSHQTPFLLKHSHQTPLQSINILRRRFCYRHRRRRCCRPPPSPLLLPPQPSPLLQATAAVAAAGHRRRRCCCRSPSLCLFEEMARLTLATRNHRQRQTSLILTWWNVVLHVVVVLLLMIFKKHRDRPRLKQFSSNVDRYPILHRWKNKVFPYYEDLCIVFGKDLAQGNRARDFVEMEQEVNVEETQASDDDIFDSDNVSRNTNLQHDETSPSVISRKRKSRSDNGFNSAVGLITESLKEISKDLSQGIKFDMKINELSNKIPPEIFKMTSLTQSEKFKALTKIRGDPVNVQNFWQVEEDNREDWVKYILENE